MNLFENDKYFVYGLPFYQEKNKVEFMKKLKAVSLLKE